VPLSRELTADSRPAIAPFRHVGPLQWKIATKRCTSRLVGGQKCQHALIFVRWGDFTIWAISTGRSMPVLSITDRRSTGVASGELASDKVSVGSRRWRGRPAARSGLPKAALQLFCQQRLTESGAGAVVDWQITKFSEKTTSACLRTIVTLPAIAAVRGLESSQIQDGMVSSRRSAPDRLAAIPFLSTNGYGEQTKG